MTIDVVIRDISHDDIESVIALWHASGIVRPWNDPAKDIAFARRDTNSTVLVADLSGRVVATAMVGEDGHRGWVYYLAADPDYQGNGLGRTMMDAAETWLAARGVWKVQLLVREDNVAVKQFYEHLGYRDTRSTCFQKIIK
jgi:ribosomal protein S18 acetylase RimI-like enzyme